MTPWRIEIDGARCDAHGICSICCPDRIGSTNGGTRSSIRVPSTTVRPCAAPATPLPPSERRPVSFIRRVGRIREAALRTWQDREVETNRTRAGSSPMSTSAGSS